MMQGPRRGLVLGAGGFLGAAWSVGALAALQSATGWNMAEADRIVGTSAGSVLAMLLRAGVSVEQLYDAHARTSAVAGTEVPDAPAMSLCMELEAEPAAFGPPRLAMGSVPLLLHAARNPLRVRVGAVCAALVPRGRRPLTAVGSMISGVTDGRSWPAGTLIVATNYLTGSRTVFGGAGSPRVAPARAVMASCAVPGWYEPVEVRKVPYVDGAVCSPCNVDLLRDAGCDEVYVLAPMASVEPDRPTTALGKLERWWRRKMTLRTLAEVERLRAAGVDVHLFTPNAEDLTVMGANMMDTGRRAEVIRCARRNVARQLRDATSPPSLTPAA
jgi:NTE family protein